MGKCGICRSEARQKVDLALRKGVSVREIARLSHFSRATVFRHKLHVKNAPRRPQSDDLKSLRAWRRILRAAMKAGDVGSAMRAQERVDAILNRAALKEPSESPAAPDRANYIRAVRSALGFSDEPPIRIAYDHNAIPTLVDQLHALVRAVADDDPTTAAIATRLASRLLKKPLDEKTERDADD